MTGGYAAAWPLSRPVNMHAVAVHLVAVRCSALQCIAVRLLALLSQRRWQPIQGMGAHPIGCANLLRSQISWGLSSQLTLTDSTMERYKRVGF